MSAGVAMPGSTVEGETACVPPVGVATVVAEPL